MQNGYGVEKNESMAATYYIEASRRFGHFGATYELGKMYLTGAGVDRSVSDALKYLSSVSAMGPWAGWVRRGLDAYLEGQHALSAMCYLHAGNVGGISRSYYNHIALKYACFLSCIYIHIYYVCLQMQTTRLPTATRHTSFGGGWSISRHSYLLYIPPPQN